MSAPKYQYRYEYDGVKGLPAIADHIGITHAQLRHRLNYLKLSLEDAVTYKSEIPEGVPVYCGEVGWAAIARKFNLNPSTLRNRVRKMGMSIEDAIVAKNLAGAPKGGYRSAHENKSSRDPYLLSDHWRLALGIPSGA